MPSLPILGRSIRAVLCVSALVLMGTSPEKASAQDSAARLLPGDSVFVLSYTHQQPQKAGYEKTAEFDAFEKTGLNAAFRKLFQGLPWERIQGELAKNSGGEFSIPSLEELQPGFEQIFERGFTLCVAIPEGEQQLVPYGVVILPGGARFSQPILNWIRSVDPPEGTIQAVTVGERKLTRFRGPKDPVEGALWSEGNDLVLYVGQNPVEQFLANPKRLFTQPEWNSAWDKSPADFVETTRVWINLERIRNKYANIPFTLPDTNQGMTANQILEPLGLTSLRFVASREGYQGRHLVSMTDVIVDENVSGWMSLKDAPTVTLANLPPLPEAVSSFNLIGLNYSQLWKQGKKTVEQLEKLIPEQFRTPWHSAKTYIGGLIEVDLDEELLQHLGTVVCSYDDSRQEIFGFSQSNFAIQMKDPKLVKKGIERVLKRIQQLTTDQQCRIIRTERHGYTMYAIQIATQVQTMTFALCENWLVYGNQPQTVEAFLLRQKGMLPKWNVENFPKDAKAKIPEKTTAIAYQDPRGSARFLVALVPTISDAVRVTAQTLSLNGFEWETPISALDIPPAELMMQPLFPNVQYSAIDGNRIRTVSLRSTNLGGVGPIVIVAGVGTVAILAATAVSVKRVGF